ncbi:MAG: alpha/beta hydrolase [Alphaproteobacteria bacterium]|nr:alpha/beta hydrolase [Alphaproteobacteria bacterium]
MTVEEKYIRVSDGLRIHYRDYPGAGEPSGAPILCLHGLTRNARDFEDLAPQLAETGRRVIVPSQRGRGPSQWDPQPERYNPVVYAADMLELLDKLDVGRAVFIGTSMGGLITMLAAARAPGRLAGAVLNDIGPEVDPAGLARIRGYVGLGGAVSTWSEAAQHCRSINGASFPGAQDDAFWLSFARKTYRTQEAGRIVPDYDPAIARAFGGAAGVPDLWPLFDALKPIPALVIRGEISDVLMISTVERMRRQKPDLGFVSIPGVGHAPFMTEPAAQAALNTFLNGLAGRS